MCSLLCLGILTGTTACGEKKPTTDTQGDTTAESGIVATEAEIPSETTFEEGFGNIGGGSVNAIYDDSVVVETNISSSGKEMLEMGVWNATTKYNGLDSKYENIFIKLTDIQTGETASENVQALMLRGDRYPFTEAPKNMEYVYLEYEVNFGADFKVSEFDGATPNVLVAALNEKGEQIEVDKTKYSVVGIDLTTSENIRKQGVGRVALLMPKGYSKARVYFGDDINNAVYYELNETE